MKQYSRRLVAYIPRAPLERDVVRGIYSVIELVDDIELNRFESDKAKMKCSGLKNLLNIILDRNKLHRPSAYHAQPPPTHAQGPSNFCLEANVEHSAMHGEQQ